MDKEKVKSITDLIDMDIVNFMEFTLKRDLSTLVSYRNLMDMELSRLAQHRCAFTKEFTRVKPSTKEFDNLFIKFIGTFVLEQKIIDRRRIIEFFEFNKSQEVEVKTQSLKEVLGTQEQ